MPGTVGSAPYESTIATLSDGASIVEAFKYYHTGGLTGSIFPNSVQYHIQSINDRADSIDDQIGYSGVSPTPASIQARLLSLESTVGTSLASTYVKMIPSSNDNNATRNFISPATSGIIPMTIQGVLGQSVDLQQWRTNAALVAKVDQNGRFYSYDGTSTAEVATLTGTQTFTNKTLTNPVQTIGTNPKTASYILALSDQSKIIEVNSSSATTVGIPLDADMVTSYGSAFATGTYIVIMQTGTGQVTIDPAVGVGGSVIVNSNPGLKTRAQWSMITLIKRGTNLWVAVGDTTS
jgi:hypothetical protein